MSGVGSCSFCLGSLDHFKILSAPWWWLACNAHCISWLDWSWNQSCISLVSGSLYQWACICFYRFFSSYLKIALWTIWVSGELFIFKVCLFRLNPKNSTDMRFFNATPRHCNPFYPHLFRQFFGPQNFKGSQRATKGVKKARSNILELPREILRKLKRHVKWVENEEEDDMDN